MKDIMCKKTQKQKRTLYRRSYKAVTAGIEASLEANANELIEQIHGIW